MVVPKLNNNDTSYILVDWLFEDGDDVPAGAAVAVVETSKAAEELVCDDGGILHQLVPLGAEFAVGTTIARLFATEADRLLQSAPASLPAADTTDVVITEPARRRAEELGVELAALSALGLPVVRSGDVEKLAASQPVPTLSTRDLSRSQRAVARVVSRTHQEVPDAFAVVKVDVGAAVELGRRLTRDGRQLVGLPELLIKAIAGCRDEFPMMFATRVDDKTVALADGSHIGVTVDVGTGLYVPVIHDAQKLTCGRIAETLMSLRAAAMEDRFRPADLTGGAIMVSLHHEPDVVIAGPIVFPGQTCVVSLPGIVDEVALDNGAVVARRVVNLAAVYDHRVVNGREAVAFLKAVKAKLENPEALTA